ncbi:uncharacterized protein LOC110042821 isoform X2 [Orbicella faveolata]|uniref:uncharacterized protein LOC110042820 isoform X7 n=1 Tax=Orbicella faveolata TaxID=48498 RepID=UPI0009E5BAA3|nr:uncharacterized protein LOC110042820 isoform X7 [Orbicella faveolata]XP_020603857.1 uncharacterized protein LOC110042821 isoform X2 [Orbicella faveolata]
MDRAQMDEQQSANNASGSNRDLMPMLEMMSQYQMSNLEVLNERHEDELSTIAQVFIEMLKIRQFLELKWVLSSDAHMVPKEL